MKWQAAAVLLILAEPVAASARAACAVDRAVFTGQGKTVSVQVEIAKTPQERAQGLMFRKHLNPDSGMLFIYEAPQPVSFWMHNTLIPLDMVFMDATGLVRHIHPKARPLDDSSVPGAQIGDPDPDRLMVLEVAGGEAARLGIHEGMVLAHPDLPQGIARQPCD
jgi:uncharacterized membrane protein (UPF0127 family)